MMRVFKEFLESSTIHGLSYISTSKSSLEKLSWASFVLTGFSLAAYLITSSYIAMQDSPVSTSISTHPTSSLAQSCKKQKNAFKGLKITSIYYEGGHREKSHEAKDIFHTRGVVGGLQVDGVEISNNVILDKKR